MSDETAEHIEKLEKEVAWCRRGLLYLLSVIKTHGLTPDGPPPWEKAIKSRRVPVAKEKPDWVSEIRNQLPKD